MRKPSISANIVLLCVMVSVLFHIIIFISFCGCLQAQTSATAIFWQGFETEWSYNQRLARLGSFPLGAVCPNHRCNSSLVQALALDREKDKARFTQHYSFVKAEGVKFYADTVSFIFSGKEKQKFTAERSLVIPDELIYPNESDYTAILNGFDLVSLEKADMIEDISIQVSDPMYEAKKKGAAFDITASLRANCKGKRCGCKNSYKYKLTVYYLVISGESYYNARSATLARKDYWNAQVPPQSTIEPITLPGDTAESHAIGLPVFKRINFSFDKAYRYAGWNMALINDVYDVKAKTCTFLPNLCYKQWKNSNPEAENHNKHSRSSRKRVGFYQVSAEVALLEFKRGCVRKEIVSGMQECFESRPATAVDNEYRAIYSTTIDCTP